MSIKLICFVTEFKVGMEIFKICPRNFTGELAKKLCKNGFITDFAAGARALCDTLVYIDRFSPAHAQHERDRQRSSKRETQHRHSCAGSDRSKIYYCIRKLI
jgi:hypothetical protein